MFTFLMFVRMAAPVNHAQNSTNLRGRRQQADGDIAAAFIKTFRICGVQIPMALSVLVSKK